MDITELLNRIVAWWREGQERIRKHPERALAAALVAAAIAAALVRADKDVLAANLGVTVYPSGAALVQVPYRADGEQGSVSVWLDVDGDGAFSDAERVVDAFPGRPRKYWNSNFFVRPSGAVPDRVRVRVAFTGVRGESVERDVAVSRSSDTGLRAEITGTTDPERSMKAGAGDGMNAGLRTADVPDLSQRPAECAPTAAANSLISLAREHGADDKLPADAATIVNELKADMRWTPADGVLPDDFVRGKNEWAAKKGLPIRTEQVGDNQGRTTLQQLLPALRDGKAAELRIRFAEPNGRGGWKAAGGHLITVVGVTETPNGTFIDVNDPRTPDGTETYRVEGNQIEGYALWPDGPTLVGIGFTQTWTGQELDPMTDAEVRAIREFAGEKKRVKAIQYMDYLIPVDQVRVAAPDACEKPHWHAVAADHCARDYRGKKVCDPRPTACGFGTVESVPVVDVDLP